MDGALGTLFVSRGAPSDGPRSPLTLSAPELVREVHDDYVSAGAQVLTANTWDANRAKLTKYDWADSLEKINRTAVRLAHDAVEGEYIYVAGLVGPLGQLVKPYGPLTTAQVREIFSEQIRILLEEGVDLLVLESFSSSVEAREALRAARELSADVTVIASVTLLADGKTSFGEEASAAFHELAVAGADIVGMNCTIGPQEALEVFRRASKATPLPMAVRPNAGYPWLVHGRAVYPATPDYFREVAREFVREGVGLLGGCCGTGPEHIAAMAREVVRQRRRLPDWAPPVTVVESAERSAPPPIETSLFKRKLADRSAFLVTAELEPPRGTDPTATVEGARALRAAGVDAVNVTDNPMARLRMSSIATAHIVKRDSGVEAIVHFTSRDRNVLGLQSDLLGAAGLGIKALLAVSGDPLKIGDYPQGKPVGEVDTLGLLRIVKALNSGVDLAGGAIGSSTAFAAGCAANPSARDQDLERSRLAAKLEAGVHFVQTQAVFDVGALDRFCAAPEARAVPVLVSVLALKSHRQALYLANEVPGMFVPEEILLRMKAAREKGPDFEREEGLAIAGELARAVAERARGLHLLPMGRYDCAAQILAELPRHAVRGAA